MDAPRPCPRQRPFQHTAARRRLDATVQQDRWPRRFQHTAARRRLGPPGRRLRYLTRFQHTAARRRLVPILLHHIPNMSFNTQPPEGGWAVRKLSKFFGGEFQHTAARRRLALLPTAVVLFGAFQHTAARRRLAESQSQASNYDCFNTQPPEGGWVHIGGQNNTLLVVSTHSRPKAAGPAACCPTRHRSVSTHSRPKAAGPAGNCGAAHCCRFNTQPPEGGWPPDGASAYNRAGFNTQPPEGGWLAT